LRKAKKFHFVKKFAPGKNCIEEKLPQKFVRMSKKRKKIVGIGGT
jgi:hypothetical protein